jgi:hypothetical protein
MPQLPHIFLFYSFIYLSVVGAHANGIMAAHYVTWLQALMAETVQVCKEPKYKE